MKGANSIQMPNIGRDLCTFAAFILLIVCSLQCLAQELPQRVPIVTAAQVPFYPALARQARLDGDVHLKVSTDGERVSAITVESGRTILVEASKANVETWRFEKHKPTSFEVTFRYRVLAESSCDMDNGRVVLNLPTQVEITAKGLKTCEPAIVTH